MLTPEDLWDKLVEEAGEDPIATATRVSPSHAEQDLRAAGFDVKAERERANAVIADLAGETAPASDGAEPTAWVTGPVSSVRRAPSNRRAVQIALALAALAMIGGTLYVFARRSVPHEIPNDVPREGPTGSAPAPPQRDVPNAKPAQQDKPN
jgi:hypothetical protein